MTYKLSRLMSTATAGYGVFALAQPAHLGKAVEAPSSEMGAWEVLARTYAVRDLAISSFGMFGRSGRTVRTAMKLRILNDVGDGLVLAARTSDPDVRQKVLAVTMGWAALNAVALAVDSRRNDDGSSLSLR
ncbi:hypothetical protein ENKNEFLB_02031 [Nocardioides aquaticus]|uniref:DUF4267 domain-containing protein n=1 Tax=Nocardioides aquaticus TaxID=160826 RepID=A0ABX8EGK3_9ACTN|nr:hypothetical protein [Nocardioides aquaticus]QVT79647.1 hypothetical protein ENKNEFLB_02031 [Nocardioides aquaticus]